MNHQYTSETMTYVVRSGNRISGIMSNCYIPMGTHLLDYPFFQCETLSFYGNSIPAGIDRVGNLDAFDFMVTSYQTNNKYVGQRITNSELYHGAHNYKQMKTNIKYIVPNFNNKIIHFAIKSESDQEHITSAFGGDREWVLLLALTPISIDSRIPKYISSKKYESFNYTILSSNIVSGTQEDGYINLPAIFDGYTKYFVEVKQINTTNLQIEAEVEFLSLYCYDWAENGFGGFENNKMLLGLMSDHTNADPHYSPNSSADNSVFVVKDMGRRRQIRFKLFKYNNEPVLNSNITNLFRYFVNCLITPIE
jgi:hypothetical protein